MEGLVQVAVGDIHGEQHWKRIVDKHFDEADRFIFIGDYVDSFNVEPIKQLENLLDIVELKKLLKDKLILLIGNHDYHYMNNNTYDKYSGYQAKMHFTFNEVFENNKDMFQMCFKDEYDTIYSHAGITNTWLNIVQISSTDPKVIADSINDLFFHKPSKFKFYEHDRGGYGDNICNSPIWIRPEALYRDGIDAFQVVGHTWSGQIDHKAKSERKGFYVIDALPNQYLKRVGSEFSIETLPKQ